MKWIVGIDEVGRGPLAGPVTVCAVAMTYKTYEKMLAKESWAELTDSKQLNERLREKWSKQAHDLQTRGTIQFATASRSAAMIDKKGIAVCIRECIAENLETLNLDPKKCSVLLDGSLKAPSAYIHQKTIIRGDSSEKIISLASVIAKVQRDHYMIALYKKQLKNNRDYGWDKNKGYGTKAHILAIKKQGITSFHRKSFLTRIIISKAMRTRQA